MRRSIVFSLNGNSYDLTAMYDRSLFRRQAKAREIGADDDVSGEAAILSRLGVIPRRQQAAWKLERILLASNRRNHVREHEVLHASTLGHGGKIRDRSLTQIGVRKHPAPLAGGHDRMNYRMDHDVGSLSQLLHLL